MNPNSNSCPEAQELDDLKARLNSSEAEISGLKHENKFLRNQLVAILQSHDAPKLQGRDTVPIGEHQKLLGRVKSLQTQILEAGERHKVEATARRILMQKNVKSKETARDWMKYSQNLKRKRNQPDNSAIPKPLELPSDLDLEDIIDAEGNLILHQTGRETQNIKKEDQDLPLVDRVSAGSVPDTGRPEVVDVPGFMSPLPRSVIEGDDRPIIISEREVKRRRVENADGNGDRLRSKRPALSTPMTAPPASRCATFRRLETWDFDETSGAKVVTPRKTVKNRQYRSVASQKLQTILRHERSQSEPVEPPDSRFVEPQQDNRIDDGNDPVKHKIIPPVHHRRRYSDGSVSSGSEGVSEGSETQFPISRVEDHGEVVIKREPGLGKKPLSSHALRQFTEDGDEFGNTKEKPKKLSRKSVENVEKSSKLLHSFLDGQDDVENVPPTEIPSSDASKLKRLSAATKTLNQATRTVGRDITNASRVQQDAGPKTRLRDLPPEQLYLSNFKINPEANQGLDYAYTDAVYGNERKCFPGCTDARCCGGALRALAATCKPALTRPPFPYDPEDTSLDDDEYLIKWHLGSDWSRQRIRGLSVREKGRLLLDARTRLLADRHAKHRTVGQRHITPPGFWDIGMPSSQEVENMHVEAAKIDRQIVIDRRAEALRGGRWLFRDE
jgi:hypothetical protein